MAFSSPLYGSQQGLEATKTHLSENEALGTMSTWNYNDELSADVVTVFGEFIWVTASTSLASPPWKGPICVSINYTTRPDQLDEMLTGMGLTLLT